MFKRGVEKQFEVGDKSVSLRQHEGNIRWNMDGKGRYIFAVSPENKNIDKLRLRTDQLIGLNNAYQKWSTQEHCMNCPLRGTTCTGFNNEPFEHYVEDVDDMVVVDSYRARLQDMSFDKTRKLLKSKALCKPRYHNDRSLGDMIGAFFEL